VKLSIVYSILLFCLFAIAQASAQSQSQSQHAPPSQMSGRQSSSGHTTHAAPVNLSTLAIAFGAKSSSWTASTLASLPHTTVTVHNEHTKADETYSGVPLIALLTPLGIDDKPHGKDLRLYVIAAGSDGYEVVYSIGEITPDIHDATVIVADAENGKPLLADGPLKLIDTRDKRPARWVRNLVSIKVLAAD